MADPASWFDRPARQLSIYRTVPDGPQPFFVRSQPGCYLCDCHDRGVERCEDIAQTTAAMAGFMAGLSGDPFCVPIDLVCRLSGAWHSGCAGGEPVRIVPD